jgi:hypothetical protein
MRQKLPKQKAVFLHAARLVEDELYHYGCIAIRIAACVHNVSADPYLTHFENLFGETPDSYVLGRSPLYWGYGDCYKNYQIDSFDARIVGLCLAAYIPLL